jgi:hypothetical protein
MQICCRILLPAIWNRLSSSSSRLSQAYHYTASTDQQYGDGLVIALKFTDVPASTHLRIGTTLKATVTSDAEQEGAKDKVLSQCSAD